MGICRRRLQNNIKYAKEFLQKNMNITEKDKHYCRRIKKTSLNTKGKP